MKWAAPPSGGRSSRPFDPPASSARLSRSGFRAGDPRQEREDALGIARILPLGDIRVVEDHDEGPGGGIRFGPGPVAGDAARVSGQAEPSHRPEADAEAVAHFPAVLEAEVPQHAGE